MVEPKDIGELEDLHGGKREEHHTLGGREADIFVERDEVTHLLVSKHILVHLMQEALNRQKLIHVVQAWMLDALAYIRRQTLVELVEARVWYLSASQPLYDLAFQCCRFALT